MADKPETALARWSRLKRAGLEPEVTTPEAGQLPAAAGSNPETEVEPDEDKREATPSEQGDTAPPLDLPDIESLNADSDFSVFLREGVSEEIRRKAFRVLWRSDPVLANLDGLNDYDEDFRATGVIAEAVRTAYKAGKGYLSEEKERATSEQILEEPEDSRAEISDAEEGVDAGEKPVATDSREAKEGAEISVEGPQSEDETVTKV